MLNVSHVYIVQLNCVGRAGPQSGQHVQSGQPSEVLSGWVICWPADQPAGLLAGLLISSLGDPLERLALKCQEYVQFALVFSFP